MTTLQIRIDDDTKKLAKKILDDVGMDMSSAIKIYLKQIVIRKGLPFQVLTENGLTMQEENSILKASSDAKKGRNITKTSTLKAAKNHLNKLKSG